jgi:hypothetical protein
MLAFWLSILITMMPVLVNGSRAPLKKPLELRFEH